MGTIIADGGGLRTSKSKPKVERHDLIPPIFIRAIAVHLGKCMGLPTSKYPERNWERGMQWRICIASFSRHWYAWLSGEKIDKESGTHHLIACVVNLMFLFVYEQRGLTQFDDRILEPHDNNNK